MSETWVSMPVKAPGWYAFIYVSEEEKAKNSSNLDELIKIKVKNAELSLRDTMGLNDNT